ncbi:hypothetical protein [Roseateles sp.]|uniref:hypothetical protein n=1 Tax=Roseateles sp. TaxID=1971397 RepID=UPI003D0B17B3
MSDPNPPSKTIDPHIELGQLLPALSAVVWLLLAYGSVTKLASSTASLMTCLAMAGAFASVLLRSMFRGQTFAAKTLGFGLVACCLLILAPVFGLDGSFSGPVDSYQCVGAGTACWVELRNALHIQGAICAIAAAIVVAGRTKAQ